MGAGRKTETYTLAHDSHYLSGTMTARLHKGDLCGVILGCKWSTIKECHAKKLFGLPAPHMAYIKNIDPGLTLFLFNYSDRTLQGIFEAASEGTMNIDPKAWSPNGTDPSPYPAQVKIRVRMRCQPLVEEEFRPAIAENYKDEKMFSFELDRSQTNKLLRLFTPSRSVKAPSAIRDVAPPAPPPTRKAIPASALVEIGDSGAPRVWSSFFKSSDSSGENKGKESEEGAHRASRAVNPGKTRGWEASAASNVDEGKAQLSVSQSGASYSAVLRNTTGSSTLEKKTSSTYEAPSQAAANSVVGRGKKVDSGEDAYSEIDWDATSAFQVHLDGLNEILEDPKDKDGLRRGFASSSMVPNHWEDEMMPPWDFGEDKSPCGSSYVSAPEDIGDDKEKHLVDFKLDTGSPNFVEILDVIVKEVTVLKENQKVLKETQMEQTAYIIHLEEQLIRSRKDILELKRQYGST
ncbi:unnamed protein product [Microthlaspi erraticum]|uniref:DCD domain-containing protein n=1 Tax=Microthlaspi erraticum TaxID=1685480 RepID=A0A6D2JNS9_9BRAS|nr:unnamed protein product [Microthlaspi erraticum]